MVTLTLQNVKKEFGADVLFSDVSFRIEEGEKVGLVGANGCGKTTLFQIILGKMPTEGGSVASGGVRFGYLSQTGVLSSDKTLYDEVLTAFAPLIQMEDELQKLVKKLEENPTQALIKRQTALSDEFARKDGYVYKSITKSALLGLGFSQHDLSLPFEALSLGQKTRANLCKILLGDYNFLLLDEPTNHLDINATAWLEGFLQSYKGSVLVISHDRYFLDHVTSATLELANNTVTAYKGNYSRFLDLKQEAYEAQKKQYELTQKEISRVEGIIAQQRQWNRERNIKTAESKQKMVDRLKKDLVKPAEPPKKLKFAFNIRPGGGNDVLEVSGLSMAFGQKRLFQNANLEVKKGERVFLLGANGCGKTTLLKILMGQEAPTGGTFRFGANIEVGYYDQAQSGLDPEKTVLDEVWDACPEKTQTEVRNALAVFLFFGDDIYKQIKKLSGGEKARVLLLKLMLSAANFLILDEPTNHLDIAAKEALEQALSGYEGTLLIVSHDRYFINKMANKIYNMQQNQVTVYHGNYDYYLQKSLPAAQTAAAEEKPKQENEYFIEKEKRAQKRRLLGKISRLEDEISQAEQQAAAILKSLESPEIASDYEKLTVASQELEQAQNHIDKLMEQWEEAQGELEEP